MTAQRDAVAREEERNSTLPLGRTCLLPIAAPGMVELLDTSIQLLPIVPAS